MGCSASRPNILLTKGHHPQHPHPDDPLSSSDFVEKFTYSSNSSRPVPRAQSLPAPLVHHPPLKKGDTHHLVSLTSTTYGSLLLIDHPVKPIIHGQDPSEQPLSQPHVTKTDPAETLSPDSVINTWELMDGLDDFDSELSSNVKPFSSPNHDLPVDVSSKCSSGFDGSVMKLQQSLDSLKFEKPVAGNSPSLSKPLWKHLSEESLLSKLDPNVVSSYRRALSSRQLGYNNQPKNAGSRGSSPRISMSVGSSPLGPLQSSILLNSPGPDDKIVLYFTSLRGIRKTFEDCCAVRMILRGFRVPVDDRDISMDSTYKKELQSALGGKMPSLPQVFIRGKHVGGAEEIKQLNEAGELVNLLEGFPVRDPRIVCESCGDARFLPCPNCNGSRKVFDEEEEQLRRCPDCNENGLIRCPGCCS